MPMLIEDMRYAVRALSKSRRFSLTAALLLTIAIGVNTLVFSLLNAVLFRPLPYQKPEELVAIWSVIPKEIVANQKLTDSRGGSSGPDFLDWEQQNRVFAEMAAFSVNDFNYRAGAAPGRLTAAGVTDGYFRTLGTAPSLGRVLQPADFVAGHDQQVVVSHRFWKSRFAGRRDVVGQTIYVENRAHTVVGVMPNGFSLPFRAPSSGIVRDPDAWVPLTPGLYNARRLNNRAAYLLGVIGRLAPGVSIEHAQREMDVVSSRLIKDHPWASRPVQLLDLRESLYGGHRRLVLLLLASAAIILLIVCANVANLQLVRTAKRRREMAIRTALGADRRRLMVQLLSESLLMSLVGGTLGLVAVSSGCTLLNAVLSRSFSAIPQVVIDVRVCGFTFGIAVLTALVFGLAPALQFAPAGVHQGLREGGRGESSPWQRHHFGKSLVVIEVMLSFILLVGAGLLTRSFIQLWRVNLGINPENVLTMKIPLSAGSHPDRREQAAFYQRILDRTAVLPGVRQAAITSSLPTMGAMQNGIDIEGRVARSREEMRNSPVGNVMVVSEGYFTAMGVDVKRGRAFGREDSAESMPAAIISESMARTYFAGSDPLGAHIRESWWGGPWRTVVGVAADVRQDGIAVEAAPALYYCSTQAPELRDITLVARTVQQPERLAGAFMKAVQSLDPDQPVTEIRSMEEVLQDAVLERRILLILMGTFAGTALALAALGIYGVLSYATSQRTREFGIRMALGAPRKNVLRMVMVQGLALAVLGIGAGVAVAQTTTHLLSTWLFGVPAGDPATYAAVISALIATSAIACYLPARRAIRIDPMRALRHE